MSPATTPTRIATVEDLHAAAGALARRDADMARALALAGPPPLRLRAPGFAGLVAIITAQQISVTAAASIFGRIEAGLRPLEPEAMIAAEEAVLRGFGLSRPKIRNLKRLAVELASGDLDLADLPGDAEAAVADLVGLPGVGRWTAESYLLFCHGHVDVWPAADLALQESARALLGLPERPSERQLRHIGERWKPLRAVAARVLWAYYRTLRGRRSGAPL